MNWLLLAIWFLLARSDVSLQKTFHTLSSLIPIAKVQVSKNLIIWLSIWHCSYHDNSKQTKWENVVVVDVAVFNRNVYFWRIWFQNGIISNRAIQGQELVLMVNFSLKSNEDYSSHISHISLPYLYTCLNVSLYYIQLIHRNFKMLFFRLFAKQWALKCYFLFFELIV
jgi:hypothetical protein